MSITMSMGGDIRKLNNHLRKLAAFDRQGINETIAQQLRTSTRLRFRQQKDPEGKAWKPSRRVLESGGVTLTQSARLRNSIRSRADSSSAEVGTNVIYAGRHQFGDKRPITIKAKTSKGLRFKIGGRWITKKQVKVQIPARPFLGISLDDQDEIKAYLEAKVQEGGK